MLKVKYHFRNTFCLLSRILCPYLIIFTMMYLVVPPIDITPHSPSALPDPNIDPGIPLSTKCHITHHTFCKTLFATFSLSLFFTFIFTCLHEAATTWGALAVLVCISRAIQSIPISQSPIWHILHITHILP